MKSIILLFLATFILMGCGLFDSSSQRITGRYILLWIDLPENQAICEETEINSSNSTGIIPEYVFAVGHNENYIIAKQHPTSGFEGGYKINVKKTNYYIVDISKNTKTLGPLKKREFDSLRISLNIQNVPFDMSYPDTP